MVGDGRLGECPPGAIVAALRALVGTAEPRLTDALAIHLSEVLAGRLRRIIGAHHPNRGEDAIDRAHGVLMVAVFDPASADGAELPRSFDALVYLRAIDAIRVERRFHQRHLGFLTGEDGESLIPADQRLDGGAGSAAVEQLLARIADGRKRLAFRLYMAGMQVRAGDPCVAAVLGVDPKTAATWIKEAKSILAANLETGV